MIKKLSHVTVYVLDQDSAKAFYIEKLGFELRQEMRVGDFRWLTVGSPEQPELEFVLMPVGGPQHDPQTEKQLREMIAKGVFGPGVLTTDDCRKTYEELSSRGVTFLSEPAERPYGVEAVFRDDSGNSFSLTERKIDLDLSKEWG